MFAMKSFAVVAVLASLANAQVSSGSPTIQTDTVVSNTGSGSAAVPSSTAGISQCILTCTITAATANGCTSITDLACICTQTAFQAAARTCLESTCTPEEQQTALGLQQAQCASFVSGSSSIAPITTEGSSSVSVPTSTASLPTASVPAGSTTLTTPTTSNTAPAASSPPPSNAATGNKVVLGTNGFMAAGVAALGAVLGAAFVL
ncbi:hypothetical protein HGRIS_004962 [Hohenbuehelia grisea]|uniref:CFEM domain-containing protein n=1 Tax=Hohenbuehelia grisea TaxID=104357 RepID=A0ABR3JDI4_9AGAR